MSLLNHTIPVIVEVPKNYRNITTSCRKGRDPKIDKETVEFENVIYTHYGSVKSVQMKMKVSDVTEELKCLVDTNKGSNRNKMRKKKDGDLVTLKKKMKKQNFIYRENGKDEMKIVKYFFGTSEKFFFVTPKAKMEKREGEKFTIKKNEILLHESITSSNPRLNQQTVEERDRASPQRRVSMNNSSVQEPAFTKVEVLNSENFPSIRLLMESNVDLSREYQEVTSVCLIDIDDRFPISNFKFELIGCRIVGVCEVPRLDDCSGKKVRIRCGLKKFSRGNREILSVDTFELPMRSADQENQILTPFFPGLPVDVFPDNSNANGKVNVLVPGSRILGDSKPLMTLLFFSLDHITKEQRIACLRNGTYIEKTLECKFGEENAKVNHRSLQKASTYFHYEEILGDDDLDDAVKIGIRSSQIVVQVAAPKVDAVERFDVDVKLIRGEKRNEGEEESEEVEVLAEGRGKFSYELDDFDDDVDMDHNALKHFNHLYGDNGEEESRFDPSNFGLGESDGREQEHEEEEVLAVHPQFPGWSPETFRQDDQEVLLNVMVTMVGQDEEDDPFSRLERLKKVVEDGEKNDVKFDPKKTDIFGVSPSDLLDEIMNEEERKGFEEYFKGLEIRVLGNTPDMKRTVPFGRQRSEIEKVSEKYRSDIHESRIHVQSRIDITKDLFSFLQMLPKSLICVVYFPEVEKLVVSWNSRRHEPDRMRYVSDVSIFDGLNHEWKMMDLKSKICLMQQKGLGPDWTSWMLEKLDDDVFVGFVNQTNLGDGWFLEVNGRKTGIPISRHKRKDRGKVFYFSLENIVNGGEIRSYGDLFIEDIEIKSIIPLSNENDSLFVCVGDSTDDKARFVLVDYLKGEILKNGRASMASRANFCFSLFSSKKYEKSLYVCREEIVSQCLHSSVFLLDLSDEDSPDILVKKKFDVFLPDTNGKVFYFSNFSRIREKETVVLCSVGTTEEVGGEKQFEFYSYDVEKKKYDINKNFELKTDTTLSISGREKIEICGADASLTFLLEEGHFTIFQDVQEYGPKIVCSLNMKYLVGARHDDDVETGKCFPFVIEKRKDGSVVDMGMVIKYEIKNCEEGSRGEDKGKEGVKLTLFSVALSDDVNNDRNERISFLRDHPEKYLFTSYDDRMILSRTFRIKSHYFDEEEEKGFVFRSLHKIEAYPNLPESEEENYFINRPINEGGMKRKKGEEPDEEEGDIVRKFPLKKRKLNKN